MEVGAALALGIPVIAIGPRENIFYWHHRVTVIPHDGGGHGAGWHDVLLEKLRGRELALL